jgi:exodeoxyribonuclease V beta subunit
VVAWVRDILETPLDGASDLRLRNIEQRRRVSEMGFFLRLGRLRCDRVNRLLSDYRGAKATALRFSEIEGLLTGYIDLVFEHRGRFYIVDYKSNYLGARVEDYAAKRLQAEIRAHHYDLQYLIYTVAVHRYLEQRLPGYDYDACFGGILYLFLRGMRAHGDGHGVFRDRPARQHIERLNDLFAGSEGETP